MIKSQVYLNTSIAFVYSYWTVYVYKIRHVHANFRLKIKKVKKRMKTSPTHHINSHLYYDFWHKSTKKFTTNYYLKTDVRNASVYTYNPNYFRRTVYIFFSIFFSWKLFAFWERLCLLKSDVKTRLSQGKSNITKQSCALQLEFSHLYSGTWVVCYSNSSIFLILVSVVNWTQCLYLPVLSDRSFHIWCNFITVHRPRLFFSCETQGLAPARKKFDPSTYN